MDFKTKSSYSERVSESNRVRAKHIDKVPIIIQVGDQIKKLLVNYDMTVSELQYSLRKKMILKEVEATILMTDQNVLLSHNNNVGSIYNQHKDNDNFLYLKVLKENTFG